MFRFVLQVKTVVFISVVTERLISHLLEKTVTKSIQTNIRKPKLLFSQTFKKLLHESSLMTHQFHYPITKTSRFAGDFSFRKKFG